MNFRLVLIFAALSLPALTHAQQPEHNRDAIEKIRRLIEDIAARRPTSPLDAPPGAATATDPAAAPGRILRSVLGSGSATSAFEIPAGIRSLLRSSSTPASITSVFSAGAAASPASSQQRSSGSATSGAALNISALVSAAKLRSITSNKADPAAASLQEAIDAAVAGIVANALNTASGIVYTVSGGLATLAAGLGIFTADFARQSSRALFGISEYSFAQTLYNDFNAQIDGSDYLGDAAKYIKLWNKLKAEISTGKLTTDMQSQMDQMATAQAILQSLVFDSAA